MFIYFMSLKSYELITLPDDLDGRYKVLQKLAGRRVVVRNRHDHNRKSHGGETSA